MARFILITYKPLLRSKTICEDMYEVSEKLNEILDKTESYYASRDIYFEPYFDMTQRSYTGILLYRITEKGKLWPKVSEKIFAVEPTLAFYEELAGNTYRHLEVIND